jgi:hypothetical protein
MEETKLIIFKMRFFELLVDFVIVMSSNLDRGPIIDVDLYL